MMRAVALFVVAGLACGNPAELTTGLSGTVERGPIAPVCQTGVPCTAGFSASFDVRQGSRRVATFASDPVGRFTVLLGPGKYTIVPSSSAPLMNPTAQTRDVEVLRTGITAVHLSFDTGIR